MHGPSSEYELSGCSAMAFERGYRLSGPHDSNADTFLPFHGKMHQVQHLNRNMGSYWADSSSKGLDLGGY